LGFGGRGEGRAIDDYLHGEPLVRESSKIKRGDQETKHQGDDHGRRPKQKKKRTVCLQRRGEANRTPEGERVKNDESNGENARLEYSDSS